MENRGNTAHIVAIVVLIVVIIYFAFVRKPASTEDQLAAASMAASSESAGDVMSGESDGFVEVDGLLGESDMSGTETVSATPTETVPVTHTPPTSNTNMTSVTLYFFNEGMKTTNSCSEVVAVTRQIPAVVRIGTQTLGALLAGPTAAEMSAGYLSDIPAGTILNSLTIDNGVARADFSSSFAAAAGECSAALRQAQVSRTLMQFPTVTTVIVTVDGESENIFTPGS